MSKKILLDFFELFSLINLEKITYKLIGTYSKNRKSQYYIQNKKTN